MLNVFITVALLKYHQYSCYSQSPLAAVNDSFVFLLPSRKVTRQQLFVADGRGKDGASRPGLGHSSCGFPVDNGGVRGLAGCPGPSGRFQGKAGSR